MAEVMIFLLFVSVGLSLWVIFYGKKVRKNGKKRKNGSKKRD